jgi:NADP-dependent 3-hydroxy acid dehydrogenase YdfG
MQWLENEVAVVTGAGSGIGRAVVHRFVEEGAKVVAFDLSQERLKTLKDELGALTTIDGRWPQRSRNLASSLSSWATLESMTAGES